MITLNWTWGSQDKQAIFKNHFLASTSVLLKYPKSTPCVFCKEVIQRPDYRQFLLSDFQLNWERWVLMLEGVGEGKSRFLLQYRIRGVRCVSWFRWKPSRQGFYLLSVWGPLALAGWHLVTDSAVKMVPKAFFLLLGRQSGPLCPFQSSVLSCCSSRSTRPSTGSPLPWTLLTGQTVLTQRLMVHQTAM